MNLSIQPSSSYFVPAFGFNRTLYSAVDTKQRNVDLFESVKFSASVKPDNSDAIGSSGMPDEAEWRKHITNSMVSEMIEMLEVDKIVSAAGRNPVTVVDIGCGPYPFYLKELAYQIDQSQNHSWFHFVHQPVKSNIFAVDISDKMLAEHLRKSELIEQFETVDGKKLKGEAFPLSQFSNYQGIKQNISIVDDKLPEKLENKKADIIIASSIYHGTRQENTHMMYQMFNSLHTGGKLLFTHWKRGYEPRGPEPHDIRPTFRQFLRDAFIVN